MGVRAIAVDGQGRHVRDLRDSSGGSFDATGDFDRLLDRVPDAVTWSSIALYGTTTLGRLEVAALLRELPIISQHAEKGPEQRGLARLGALAALCESGEAMSLHFIGD